jgi:hypothetical protein
MQQAAEILLWSFYLTVQSVWLICQDLVKI